jgi:death-on-curing protein
MRYLSLVEVLELHEAVVASSGGSHGIRDIKALESSVSQPRLTFDNSDLYPDIVSKAASLCFSLVMNHPFVDGNKRVGHAAMETFLILNGYEINATQKAWAFFALSKFCVKCCHKLRHSCFLCRLFRGYVLDLIKP